MTSPDKNENSCPDCQAEIETLRGTCPQCGCPLDTQKGGNTARNAALVLIVALLVAVIGLRIYTGQVKPDEQSQAELAEQFAQAKPVQPLSKNDLSCSAYPVAFLPDGETTAWGYQNNDVLITRHSERVAVLDGHVGPVLAVAFAPASGLLASGSADNTIKLWRMSELRASLTGHAGAVTAVAFSRDGRVLASASEDQTVRLWDVGTGEQLAVLSGHEGTVTALTFHVGRNELASASVDQTIRIWDLESGRELSRISTLGAERIRGLLFAPDGVSLVSIGRNATIRMWNLETQTLRGSLKADGPSVSGIAFSPDGRRLASATPAGKVQLWDTATGAMTQAFSVDHPVVGLWFSPDGRQVVWPETSAQFLREVRALTLLQEAGLASQAAEEAMAEFQIPHGLQVDLFACEPMVANPASICFDEQGRVYVAETFRYRNEVSFALAGLWVQDDLASQTTADRLRMYEKWQDESAGGMAAHTEHAERIRRLVDSDGDGRADSVTVFTDGYNDPLDGTGTGLLARGGKLYYTCIPKLWMLADTDDDGVADQRDALHDGFGVCASFPHGLHGLAWGPDGKLYFSVGDRGYHVETAEGRTLHNPGQGAIFRCNRDGSDLEEIAWGFRNPQELAFDQYGNLFTCDNNSAEGDACRLIYVVRDGDYGWHMAYETMSDQGAWSMDLLWETAEKTRAAWVVPPIQHLSKGPSGLVFYPGVGLPDRYQNHFFLCDFQDRKEASSILSFGIKPQGAGFETLDTHKFVSNILPTDVEFGHDGKMYIADWIQGSTGTGMGRIYTLADPARAKDPTIQQTVRLFREGFGDRGNDELAQLLHHPNQRVRLEAQFALAERGTDAVPILQKVAASNSNLLARVHAIWSLGMIGRTSQDALSHVAPLLGDRDDEIRAQAAKVLGEGNYVAAADRLQALLKDPQPRVRFFAAMAIGDLKHQPSIPALVELLRENDDQDPFLRHAGVSALHAIGDAEGLRAFTDDANRSVRLAVLLTLRRFGDPKIAVFLGDDDEDLVTEAARAIHDVPIVKAMPALAGLLEKKTSGTETLLRRAINASFRLGGGQHALALAQFAAADKNELALRIEAVQALADWAEPSPRDRVLGVHRPLPKRDTAALRDTLAPILMQLVEDSPGPLQYECMKLAGALKIPGVEASLLEWVTDDTRPAVSRCDALQVLASIAGPTRSQAIEAALASPDPIIRAEATRVLAQIDPDRAFGMLTKALNANSIVEQQQAFATLGKMEHSGVDPLLSDWLDRLTSGSVPPRLHVDLIEAAFQRRDPIILGKCSAYTSSLNRGGKDRFQLLTHGGDERRGRTLFDNRAKTQCRRCHVINGDGGSVGPDLSKCGDERTREYLVESLLFPNQTIAKGFEQVVVTTNSGKIISGIRQSEDENKLVLRTANGEDVTVAISDIDERRVGKSVMPEDLQERLSLLEIRDLVEFLANLK